MDVYFQQREKYYLRALGKDVRRDRANFKEQFPELAEDLVIPEIFPTHLFFSSVFRISSPGVRLWTHYDVRFQFSVLMNRNAIDEGAFNFYTLKQSLFLKRLKVNNNFFDNTSVKRLTIAYLCNITNYECTFLLLIQITFSLTFGTPCISVGQFVYLFSFASFDYVMLL